MNTYLYHDSLSELAEFVKNGKPHPNGNHSSHKDRKSDDWDLGVGWDGAQKMLDKGGYWPEGRKLLQDGLKRLTASDEFQELQTEITQAAPHGFMPLVPEYLMGVPECMLSLETVELETPVVSLGVSAGFSASCDAQAMLNRGMAIVALVDALEASGIRVEVFSVWDSSYSDNQFSYKLKVKGADQIWDADSFAYILGHPAFFRRILFTTMEYSDAWPATNQSYGQPADYQAKDFDGYFKSVKNDSPFKTPESALETVRETYKASRG